MLTIQQKASLEKAWTQGDTPTCLEILKSIVLEPRCSTCSVQTWLISEISDLIAKGELFN